MFYRYKFVLFIPLVLKVNAFVDECRYSVASEVWCSACVCVGLFGAFVGFWLRVPWVRCHFLYFLVCFFGIWICS